MTAQEKLDRAYTISTLGTVAGLPYRVCYASRDPQSTKGSRTAKKLQQAVAVVNVARGSVTWEKPPTDSELAVDAISADALRRAKIVDGWLTRLTGLIESVEQWAKSLGWSARKIEKPMEDSEVGKYFAPALLLQDEMTKVLLEPITHRAPGTQGVVDLYLMPGYDDIASLYYYDNRWNLHYASAQKKTAVNVRDAEVKSLTKTNLARVLEEMKEHVQ